MYTFLQWQYLSNLLLYKPQQRFTFPPIQWQIDFRRALRICQVLSGECNVEANSLQTPDHSCMAEASACNIIIELITHRPGHKTSTFYASHAITGYHV